jgi:hypothetical protein
LIEGPQEIGANGTAALENGEGEEGTENQYITIS